MTLNERIEAEILFCIYAVGFFVPASCACGRVCGWTRRSIIWCSAGSWRELGEGRFGGGAFSATWSLFEDSTFPVRIPLTGNFGLVPTEAATASSICKVSYSLFLTAASFVASHRRVSSSARFLSRSCFHRCLRRACGLRRFSLQSLGVWLPLTLIRYRLNAPFALF